MTIQWARVPPAQLDEGGVLMRLECQKLYRLLQVVVGARIKAPDELTRILSSSHHQHWGQ